MRRALHILSVSLITAGIVIAADVVLTLFWQEPLSTVYGAIQQGRAEDSLDELETSFLARDDVEPLPAPPASEEKDDLTPAQQKRLERRVRDLARIFDDEAEPNQGIGKIIIPSIGVDSVVIEGTDPSTLQKGPGRYPETAFPGQGQTIGIAGHRTTYGAPFRKINEIADGDRIVVEMPYATFTYEVVRHQIVEPSQTEIVRNIGEEQLVLTACHPLYSAAQRWAVFARLTEVSAPT